jgi:hypothetical protein
MRKAVTCLAFAFSLAVCASPIPAANAGDAKTMSNLANMRHEMLKTVANNLRAREAPPTNNKPLRTGSSQPSLKK